MCLLKGIYKNKISRCFVTMAANFGVFSGLTEITVDLLLSNEKQHDVQSKKFTLETYRTVDAYEVDMPCTP
jgi:hypothetical protein